MWTMQRFVQVKTMYYVAHSLWEFWLAWYCFCPLCFSYKFGSWFSLYLKNVKIHYFWKFILFWVLTSFVDLGHESVSEWIRIAPKKEKNNVKNDVFLQTECSLLRAGCFLWSLEGLYEGLIWKKCSLFYGKKIWSSHFFLITYPQAHYLQS